MDELGSPWASTRTDQTVWPISRRVTDPTGWPINWRIRVRPCIWKHTRSTGACFHRGWWLGAYHHLTPSLHFTIQLHSSSVMWSVSHPAISSHPSAGVRRANQGSTCRTIRSSIKWLGKTARHWRSCRISRVKAPRNTMWLNWYGISKHWRQQFRPICWSLHDGNCKCFGRQRLDD